MTLKEEGLIMIKDVFVEIKGFSPIFINSKNVDEINQLLKELTPNSRTLDIKNIIHIVLQDNLKWIVACRKKPENNESESEIVGMGIVFFVEIPTGLKAVIEDVVVSERYRGNRIGEAIIEKLIAAAQEKGAKYIDLTSAPSRTAANALYKKLGFKQRNTNCYRLALQ